MSKKVEACGLCGGLGTVIDEETGDETLCPECEGTGEAR